MPRTKKEISFEKCPECALYDVDEKDCIALNKEGWDVQLRRGLCGTVACAFFKPAGCNLDTTIRKETVNGVEFIEMSEEAQFERHLMGQKDL